MTSVTISDKTRKYLDRLRKRTNTETIPSLKEIADAIASYTETHEEEFLRWFKHQ